MGLTVHNLFENLFRQPSKQSQKTWGEETIKYWDNNQFPLKLARLVQNSPTASACIATKTNFINGNGFGDAELEELVVNSRGETLEDIKQMVSGSLAIFDGFALNVKYNPEGRIIGIFSVPFEYCRLGESDSKGNITKIGVNPYYGTDDYKTNETVLYDVYNPKVAIEQATKKSWPGQIMFVGKTSPLSRFYPLPKYYSSHYYMAIDEAIGGFHHNNIQNGFFQSVLLNIIGDENAPSMHPDDQVWNETNQQYEPNPQKTNAYRFNIEMQKFAGWQKAGNVMALWARIKEEAPTITPFPANTNSELFRTIQDLATEQIARSMGIPSVLANIQSGASISGEGNTISTSVILMQQSVKSYQKMIEKAFTDLLTNFKEAYAGDVKIIDYNAFPKKEQINPLIWEVLPLETKLKYIRDNTEFEIPETVTPPTSPAPVNSFANAFHADYPDKAKANAVKARKYKDQSDSKCGGKGGWEINQTIIEGKPISFKKIKSIKSFLQHKQTFSNHLFSDSCEALLYSSWGGNEMLDWATNKIKSINE